MLTHDASKCPLGNNPPPPPPQDDDEDRDYNPEKPDGNFPGIAEEPMNGNADNNAQEGNANEEANQYQRKGKQSHLQKQSTTLLFFWYAAKCDKAMSQMILNNAIKNVTYVNLKCWRFVTGS